MYISVTDVLQPPRAVEQLEDKWCIIERQLPCYEPACFADHFHSGFSLIATKQANYFDLTKHQPGKLLLGMAIGHNFGHTFQSMDIKEYLHKLLALVQMEREEDLRQYQSKMLYTNIADRKKEGVTWYPIIMTGHGLGSGDKLVVELEKTSDFNQPHGFQGGATVSLFCNSNQKEQETTTGIIASVRDKKMKVVLNADELPDWIYDGRLGVNLMYDESTYREMEHTLKHLSKMESGRTAELRDIIYGKRPPAFSKTHPIDFPKLNPSQNKALQNLIAAKDIAIIHGPPGTGKTTTLVQAIRYTVESEKQVLVCTPSNASVDLLVEKLAALGLEVLRMGHPARISEAAISSSLDARIAAHQSYRDLRQVRRRAEEMREVAMKYKRNFGHAERQQRKEVLNEARRLKGEAYLIEQYITQSLLDKAQVVVATLAGANHQLLRGKVFKTVFIDEASQALEPACWIPMLKAERVVMAGDHKQLPPTVKSYEAAKQGLSYTLFERVMDKLKVDSMLTNQYRMHPQIMGFSSKIFYKNELQADSIVLSRPQLTDSPVEYIDTAGCGFTEKTDPLSLSTYNSEEAALLVKHFMALLEQLGIETLIDNQVSVGIIAPYKAQVALINDLLDGYLVENNLRDNVSVNTVDAFQGQERDIMYISLTRSNDAAEIGFLKDTRRTNVALTRARHKLVVIGDSATLGSDAFYDQMVAYFQEIGAYRSAFELIYI